MGRLRRAALLPETLPQATATREAYVPSFLQKRLAGKVRVAQTGR